jgi:hypothetical protein
MDSSKRPFDSHRGTKPRRTKNGSLEIMDTNRWASPCNIKYASCTGRRPHHPNQRLSQGHVDRAPTSQGKGEATATNLDSKHTEYFSADPRKTDRVRHPRQSSSTEDWDEMPTQRALRMERMRSRAPTAKSKHTKRIMCQASTN